MPTQISCPISEVDHALSKYINSHEDTLKIRRALSNYITNSLRPVNAAKGRHLTHECPQNISAVSTNPPGLKGFRLDYLQALRAHNHAQAKHRDLSSSLEELQQRHVDENPTQARSDYDNGTTYGYISLLRQRRRLAELQVIQDSLEKLLAARPQHAQRDPKALVTETSGEPPNLPAERLEQLSQSHDNQSWSFKLKQEVLEARSGMDRANASRTKAENESKNIASLQQHVQALECARNEIVEWVQDELTKMEEDSVFLENASPVKRSVDDITALEPVLVEQRIGNAYNQYTVSRTGLIEEYESLQQPLVAQIHEQGHSKTTSIEDKSPLSSHSEMPINSLFPHLSHLVHISNNERTLLQQSVFLQTQILSADQELEDALLRLSGESHLLPAGTKEVTAWSKTAAVAEIATETFVKEHLQASRQEVSSANRTVELCSLQNEVLTAV
ncbi:hypothetical protein GQ44DRAFT_765941 [Phaeosphaeriaceae sp. PMI808]|nr:hypothetical protein GQ44DRAFT_765941 [Phaeosphaeriaceae sp. PMI808]